MPIHRNLRRCRMGPSAKSVATQPKTSSDWQHREWNTGVLRTSENQGGTTPVNRPSRRPDPAASVRRKLPNSSVNQLALDAVSRWLSNKASPSPRIWKPRQPHRIRRWRRSARGIERRVQSRTARRSRHPFNARRRPLTDTDSSKALLGRGRRVVASISDALKWRARYTRL